MFVFQAVLTHFEASMSLGESFIPFDYREQPVCNRTLDCKLNSNLFSIDIICFASTPDCLPSGAPIDQIKLIICENSFRTMHALSPISPIAYTVGDNRLYNWRQRDCGIVPQRHNCGRYFRVGVCPLHWKYNSATYVLNVPAATTYDLNYSMCGTPDVYYDKARSTRSCCCALCRCILILTRKQRQTYCR